jgi:hypothetical protein
VSASITLVTGPGASGKLTFAGGVHAALTGLLLLGVDEPLRLRHWA